MNQYLSTSQEIDAGSFMASRRRFLKMMACSSLLTLSEAEIANAAGKVIPAHKTLALEHVHTGDKLKLTYFEQGCYVEEALREINYLLRDYHTGAVHPIDPALLDQLYDLKIMLGINRPFFFSSGYRTPRTNARLRKKCRCGAAKHSLHMQGRAVDFHVEGLETRKIRNAALAMRRGGVGYYRRQNFIHLDTGRFRTW